MGKNSLSLIIILLFCLIFLSACDVHPGGKTKQDIATEKNKPSICLDASAPDICLLGVALANNNPEACELMEDDYSKNSCLGRIKYDEQINNAEDSSDESKICKYDSECPSICEGDIMWKQGCNPREGICEKTFNTVCSELSDSVAGFEFPRTCEDGKCIRNTEEIARQRAELVALQADISANVKNLNAYRQEVTAQKLDANNKCLDGLSDVTNMFIIDSALRLGSVISSGVNYIAKGSDIVKSTSTLTYSNDELERISQTEFDFASKFSGEIVGAMGDYAGQVTDKLYNLKKSEEANKKPSVEEYIAFYCDYNKYLGDVLDVTGEQLDQQIALAKVLESQINTLK